MSGMPTHLGSNKNNHEAAAGDTNLGGSRWSHSTVAVHEGRNEWSKSMMAFHKGSSR